MGILAMNIVAFAMIPQAYINPLAYGTESAADLASWAFSFVFIDGKMRGLFSFLFGASMLLGIQLAEAKATKASSLRVPVARTRRPFPSSPIAGEASPRARAPSCPRPLVVHRQGAKRRRHQIGRRGRELHPA